MGKNFMTRPYLLAPIPLFKIANKKPIPLLILLNVNNYKSPFIFFNISYMYKKARNL